jgi:hypothetical protein
MTVPAVSLAPRTEVGLGVGASAGELLDLASCDDFHRWEAQLAATGHCARPIRLEGRIDAIDKVTGRSAPMYDTAAEPGGVLRIACGNRREDVCPACSEVYKGDARQIIRSGLTGGKGVPDTVAAHPAVFATLTAPGFGPVHTTRTGRAGRLLPCRPRRDANQRRCRHGRDISCPRTHQSDDPRLGRPMCPDCYDYTGHILFNALAPELWRRFTIYLPRQLARLAGITQKQFRAEARVRFVKVVEYQARGVVHYHAIVRLDAATADCQPPPASYTAGMLSDAIRQAATVVSYDTAAVTAADPSLGRILRFGTQIDTRVIHSGGALSAQAVANYIAKYATKTTGAPGLPHRPVNGPAAIAGLHCAPHHKRLISTCWELGKHPAAAELGLNRWTHMLGYRGHFLTKSRSYSATFAALRQARIVHRRQQRHADGEKDPWGRDLDERTVLLMTTWRYAGTGHATTAERQLALAAAARAREHDQIAREETWKN